MNRTLRFPQGRQEQVLSLLAFGSRASRLNIVNDNLGACFFKGDINRTRSTESPFSGLREGA